jgi:SAM-dependent methyltransferase
MAATQSLQPTAEASPQTIAEEAAYAVRIASMYEAALPASRPLAGTAIMELGPGRYFGAALVLACRGARVTVADRYLERWHDATHVPFCDSLKQLLRGQPQANVAVLDAVLDARDFAPALTALDTAAECLGAVADGAFDVTCSTSVLEHIEDVPRAVQQIARITAPGGLAIHSVDFRDHADFDHPLEYLAFDADVFWDSFARSRTDRGNRWRHTQFVDSLQQAGFALLAVAPGLVADDGYVRDIRPRLHPDFARLTDGELSTLSALIICTRTTAPARRPAVPYNALLPPASTGLTRRSVTRRIVVYGAGEGGREALTRLEGMGLADCVVAVCDGDRRKHGQAIGIHTIRPFEGLAPSDYDAVVIATRPGRADLTALLTSMGFTDDVELRPLGFIGAYGPGAQTR